MFELAAIFNKWKLNEAKRRRAERRAKAKEDKKIQELPYKGEDAPIELIPPVPTPEGGSDRIGQISSFTGQFVSSAAPDVEN